MVTGGVVPQLHVVHRSLVNFSVCCVMPSQHLSNQVVEPPNGSFLAGNNPNNGFTWRPEDGV